MIVPAWNAAATLPACLAAIAALTRPADEVIVFDDGSTDATAAIAVGAGARLLANPGAPLGPAHGRNIAAAAARTTHLLFIDADVVVAADALALMLDEIAAHHACAAFGSYDDRPGSTRRASLYANLRHHFVHQQGARDAGTFWSGLGLIERSSFLEVGGFDAARFPRPSVEDIDLGMRLRAQGHCIRLVPEAQGQHCKDWTLWRVWHTDIVLRARPWARLIVARRVGLGELNAGSAEQVKAALAVVAPALALAGIAAAPAALAGAATALAGYAYLNRRLYRFFADRMPPAALAQAIWMHWCYHIYASATFGATALFTRAGRVAPLPRS